MVLALTAGLTLRATTKAPTTTAPAPTTSPNMPTSICSTTGGVPIGTGDNAKRVVDTHGPGTRYTVKAGIHLRNFSVQQDRPDATPPAHLLDIFQVHDNVICATGGNHPTGVVADNGANLATRDITFTRNTIQAASCRR